MKLTIVTPVPRGSHTGNRITAERYARLLRGLGHRVRVTTEWDGSRCEVLIALHASRSASSMRHAAERCPQVPRILILTGTDLYRDLEKDAEAQRSLEIADRLVVLSPGNLPAVPSRHHGKTSVIVQAAEPVTHAPPHPRGRFRYAVVAHLRPEKDPLRVVRALDHIPAESAIQVCHAGAALDPVLGRKADHASRSCPRYSWLGDLPPARARELIASSEGLILTSRMEGGPNVVSEAVVQGVPVLTSDILSSVALLGEEWPAVFPVGDERALAGLMVRFERDEAFRNRCRAIVRRLRPRFTPERERAAWTRLLRDL